MFSTPFRSSSNVKVQQDHHDLRTRSPHSTLIIFAHKGLNEYANIRVDAIANSNIGGHTGNLSLCSCWHPRDHQISRSKIFGNIQMFPLPMEHVAPTRHR
ncbi:uncharacterized protein LACBIDRAFT_310189 [Laccaria bicolor S238N-H82]|uniref:Predicted protein n=1 Tax=Laccaria bicolor (strain S238N-H82 / ATCC MYA-4686) TaxID=486041 RepID=B0DTN9_LACBS|nr:uncharacterized protein LACBIDRAFT_310189 [Laccaria bicolor S238N-H82]EDR02010.1 predicted protein [Laccaria bicolor S238N-H82]|eukprot:XP_001887401.1 predicted protein [Laccaria bicolor S238N-H82]